MKGKLEEVELPIKQFDIIISEWMGYFLSVPKSHADLNPYRITKTKHTGYMKACWTLFFSPETNTLYGYRVFLVEPHTYIYLTNPPRSPVA